MRVDQVNDCIGAQGVHGRGVGYFWFGGFVVVVIGEVRKGFSVFIHFVFVEDVIFSIYI